MDLVGTLLPSDEATISSVLPGTVQRILADLGDRVRRGQTLAQFDEREHRLAVEQAQATLAAAVQGQQKAAAAVDATRANLERVRANGRVLAANLERARAWLEDTRSNQRRLAQLEARGLISTRELESARTQEEMAEQQVNAARAEYDYQPQLVRAAEAQLASDQAALRVADSTIRQWDAAVDLARKKLGDLTITAPLTGAVSKRLVSAGEAVRENVPLFVVVATDPLKLQGAVAERYVSEVAVGKTVTVQVDAFPGRAFSGRISRISPAITPETRSLTVEALIRNEGGLLKPGLFARASILARRVQALMVPQEAVYTLAGITKVFVVDPAKGTVMARRVTLGPRADGWVEVEGQLRAGDRVATSSLSQLEDGGRILLRDQKGS